MNPDIWVYTSCIQSCTQRHHTLSNVTALYNNSQQYASHHRSLSFIIMCTLPYQNDWGLHYSNASKWTCTGQTHPWYCGKIHIHGNSLQNVINNVKKQITRLKTNCLSGLLKFRITFVAADGVSYITYSLCQVSLLCRPVMQYISLALQSSTINMRSLMKIQTRP